MYFAVLVLLFGKLIDVAPQQIAFKTYGDDMGGGSQTTETKVPQWLEDAGRMNMARANDAASIGYVPYYGPDVAAMTPNQTMAMQNTNSAASAFGLGSVDPMAGMPQSQTFAGGLQGYSSAPMFEAARGELQQKNPAQYAALLAPFINPQSGAAGKQFYQPPSVSDQASGGGGGK